MTAPTQIEAAENTDRELWRERDGDYYADSIHVTKEGNIGINCGGNVVVMPLRKWFALTAALVTIEDVAAVSGRANASFDKIAADRAAEVKPDFVVPYNRDEAASAWKHVAEGEENVKTTPAQHAEAQRQVAEQALTAAAEVGGNARMQSALSDIANLQAQLKSIKADTIERCVQVVMECQCDLSNDERRQVAAAISALKDKP